MTTATSSGISSKTPASSSLKRSRSSSTAAAWSACPDSWRAEKDSELLSTQASEAGLGQDGHGVRGDRLDLLRGALELVVREHRRALEGQVAVELDPGAAAAGTRGGP